jgi:cytochrome c
MAHRTFVQGFVMKRFAILAVSMLCLALSACGPSGQSDTSAAPAPVAQGPTPEQIATAMAALPPPYSSADYEAGRRVFAQCRSCHTIDASGANRTGPHLHGVFGRHVGAVEGFAYSPALQGADFTWDADSLSHWVENPREFLPGNRMAFAGVRDETQRKNLIAYLMVESAR